MIINIDKELLYAVIDELPPEELSVIYKMINDYKDRRLTPEEQAAHLQALEEDEWYD